MGVVLRRIVCALLVVISAAAGPVVSHLAMSSRDAARAGPSPSCPPLDLSTTTVAVWGTTSTSGLTTPRVSSEAVIRVPMATAGAGSLLADPAEAEYRVAIGCLLGIDEEQNRQSEYVWPLVLTVTDDVLEIRYPAFADIASSGWTKVGLVDAYTDPETQRVFLWARPRAALDGARWTSVTFEDSGGALDTPWPDRPETFTSTRVTWDGRPPGTEYFSTWSTPETRVRFAGKSGVFPWTLVGVVVGALGLLVAAGSALHLLRRVDRAVGTDGTRRPFVLGRATVVLLGALLLVKVCRVVAPEVWDEVSWPFVYWAVGLVLLPVLWYFAVVWGVSRLLATAVVLGFAGLCAGVGVAGGVGVNELDLWAEPHLIVLLYSGASFAAGWLVAAALVKAVLAISGRSPGAWATGTVSALLAGALAVEQVWIEQGNLQRHEWALAEPFPGSSLLGNNIQTYSFMLLDQVSGLALVLAAACVLASAAHLRGTDWHLVRTAGVVLVALAALPPSVSFWGWSLPVWIALVLMVLWALRRVGSVLTRIAPDEVAWARLVSPAGVRELSAMADDRGRVVAAGRALDKALTGGTVTPLEYAEKLSTLGEPAKVGLLERVANRFAKKQPAPAAPLVLPADTRPTDVLLAIGPHPHPAANAAFAAKAALALGSPAIAYVVWTHFEEYILIASTQTYSVLLGQVFFAAGQVAKWFFAGAALGLLWQVLPGKRGPVKTLFLIVPAVAEFLVGYLPSRLTGGPESASDLASVLLFTATLSLVGFLMDMRSLRPMRSQWARPGQALLAAYGVNNLATQFTFILAQVAAGLAIWNFLTAGGDPPSYPSIDPFSMR